MSTARACCCTLQITDCLFGDTTDTGCCHGGDDLLLWCERPGFSVTQQLATTNIGSNCQWHYTISQAALPPVQAVYRYQYDRWRCVIPQTTPESLYTVPARCPPDWNAGAQCYDPSLYLCGGSMSHCNAPSPPVCLCNSTWLTPWRKSLMLADTASKWLIEATCFKNGSALGGGYGSLYNQFLCIVHREHFWKVPEGECAANGYIRVPGCAAGDCTGTAEGACGNAAYNTSQLVPKWWIYACSGVPIFLFDLDNAVDDGTITSTERGDFINAIGIKNQPNQNTLRKLASGGYLNTTDWRCQQRQDFVDLNDRFPGAGYAACIQRPEDMALLGPIRKRLTVPYQNPPTVVPLLNRDDCDTTQLPLNVGAACFIDYPGGAASRADYEFWAARQWVYFRAAPGGWSWVGWNAVGDSACVGQGFTEEQAILHGCGRNDPSCIEALKGNPRPLPCCEDKAPICSTATHTRCFGCGNPPPECPCGNAPTVGCDLFSPGPVPTQCSNLVVSPSCLGVRFAYAQYVVEGKLTAGGEPPCKQTLRYRCAYVARSFLTEARRSSDSWSSSVCFKCRAESPKQDVWNDWPQIVRGHYGIAPICDSIVAGNGEYATGDLCCSGHCWNFRYVPGQPTPCLENGVSNPCPAATDCPPHSTAAQIGCIGFTPDCT